LSMGTLSVLPFSYSEELTCPLGEVELVRVTNPKSICIDQDTALRWNQLGIAEILGEIVTVIKVEKPVQEELPLGIEIIETRSGTITLDHDYLTPESAKLLSDELFFQRAVQVYHQSLPAVGLAGIFIESDKVGYEYNDVFYWSTFLTPDFEILTGNVSVLYYIAMLNLSDGPVVVEAPCCVMGAFNNLYQQVIEDVGNFGPYKGDGGLFVALPPNYDGEIPEGHAVVQSDTLQNLFLGRSFVLDGDLESAIDRIKQVKIYNLSDIDNPPEQKFIDLKGQSLMMAHPTTEGFWEFLHEVYSKETIIRPEDRTLIGLMHSIGIIPGEPFEPDEHSKELLEKAAVIADLMARKLAYDSPFKESFVYYPGTHWLKLIMSDNPRFEDERGATQIEQRLTYVYQAVTTGQGMVENIPGIGSKYLGSYQDSNGEYFDGSNLYKIHLPANPPAERFWSFVVYDMETRSMIVTDQERRPGFGNVVAQDYIQNEDGSYDFYVGPESPEGLENNWVKTNEGDGFFLLFRSYFPTEAFFDKSWQLPDVELVE